MPPSPGPGTCSVKDMSNSDEIRDFLVSRRARITPEQAGLPMYGGKRRVPGLRREEVALLVGISVEYYTRLERGNARGVSESVLEGLARALQLDDAERAHLFDLVHAANASRAPSRRPAQQRVRPSIQRLLDSMTVPAFVQNGRLTSSTGTASGARSFPISSPMPGVQQTARETSSSTPAQSTSTRSGRPSPTTSWRCCAPRPDAIPTTAASRI